MEDESNLKIVRMHSVIKIYLIYNKIEYFSTQ